HMSRLSISTELRSRLYALVSTVPCPLMPGPRDPVLSLFHDVHGVERLTRTFVVDSNSSAVVTLRTSQVGLRLIDVDKSGLDVRDELAAYPSSRCQFDVGDFHFRIRGGILVDPATHRIRSRNDRNTSIGWSEMVLDLPAETLVVRHPDVKQREVRGRQECVQSPSIAIEVWVPVEIFKAP